MVSSNPEILSMKNEFQSILWSTNKKGNDLFGTLILVIYAFKSFFKKNIWDLNKHIKKRQKMLSLLPMYLPISARKINKMKFIIEVKKKITKF